ncbi:hypothetical protein VCV18_011188 [Metarhizium anisopliae]
MVMNWLSNSEAVSPRLLRFATPHLEELLGHGPVAKPDMRVAQKLANSGLHMQEHAGALPSHMADVGLIRVSMALEEFSDNLLI